ncbi:hypothetical protein QBC32DRAFT_227600 [Pseudoneurospora amorphoporcata]|uniref:DNA mismatch repair protein S5 domain-containing protein n=1 Tax=Pseudoneurospora amorphoporcata TaxID=241081 RepID=A0AAN6P2I4_9PEZI|nr:hypothetical protein QBC32DRAFT_227600 [Pseudoneurospora amorphoporcata]
MPIYPLPEDTKRLLGSTLVITSPIFLVKELLDNAIDAGATAVDIRISPNTLDKVEVRDNGSGISPSDFDLLGRPGHTSKLTSLQDLETVGCKSLGFRGVALASAAALAEIAICTRTSDESVATILKLSKEGVAAARGHQSAPVGTSVCVTSLFGGFPVRHKRATSETPATILKIKGLMECYALARPQVKLSFKVLGGKQWWCYVPSSGAALKDAVVQVMGRELAAQCMLRTSPFPVSGGDNETRNPQRCSYPQTEQPSKFVFEAYLPTSTANIRKICKGPFISVDSRPLSFTQGTAKRLKAVFEKRFKGSLTSEDSSRLSGSPFIRLNIRCPPGSYDPNVEPSKHDVLFHDEELVLREFEEFLLPIYNANRNDTGRSGVDTTGEAGEGVCNNSVADQHVSTPQVETTRADERGTGPQRNRPVTPSSNNRRPSNSSTAPLVQTWSVDMSAGDGALSDGDDDVDVQTHPGKGTALTTPPTDDELDDQSKKGLNPWTIAKLVAPRRQTQQNLSSPTRKTGHIIPDEVPPSEGPSVGVPERQGNTQYHSLRNTQLAIENNHATTRTPTRNPLLNVGQAHSQPANQRNNGSAMALEQYSYTTQGQGRRPADRRSYPTHSGRSPGMVQSKLSFGGGSSKRQRKTRTNDIHEPEPPENTGPNAYGGFARPNQPLIGLPSQHTARRTNNDARRRTTAQTRADSLTDMLSGEMSVNPRTDDDLLFAVEGEKGIEAALPKNDPRGYLIRRQRPLAIKPQRRKIQRLKTNLLPLETTPQGCETHKLTLKLIVDPQALASSMEKASILDSYLVEGVLEDELEDGISPEEVTALKNRVNLLLSQTKHQS